MSTQLNQRLAALFDEGLALHRQSNLDGARLCYERIVALEPGNSRAWHLLAVLASESGQWRRALQYFERALEYDPRHADALNGCARAHLELAQYEAAVAFCDRAIELDQNRAQFHSNRGNALMLGGRHAEALDSYDRAISLAPRFAGNYRNKASALSTLKRYEAALESLEQAIALEPANARSHLLRGDALYDLGRMQASVASYEAALSLEPHAVQAHQGRGNALLALEQFAAALASYDRVVELGEADAETYNNRGTASFKVGRLEAALSDYERALALNGALAGVHFNRAQMLEELGQPAAAIPEYARTLELEPGFKGALGHLLLARMQCCDWSGLEAGLTQLAAHIERGEPAATPFAALVLIGSARLQRLCARNWNAHLVAASAAIMPRRRTGRVRIGYFSGDFRNHPVAYLMAGVFAAHDRDKFEVFGFSLGPPIRDEMRERLERTFDRLIDVYGGAGSDIAAFARQMGIDIAIDLSGFTKGAVTTVFTARAAPIQASYLGFLGTMELPQMDYMMADVTLVPESLRQHYAERLVFLPSYQANDFERAVEPRGFLRAELGLPERGFVFCCFNTNYKLTPAMFDVWMRILGRVEGAVLFLYAASDLIAQNLRREAELRGVDAARIIFGERLPLAKHLTRYRLADLFLDTLPYNAGTTASDALWVGLPVLTCAGETFAGRIAASVLEAAGFPELIAASPQEYEEKAVRLASHPDELAQIRDKLTRQRSATTLFDTIAHTRALEAAYAQMIARQDAGLAPDDLQVAPSPQRLKGFVTEEPFNEA